MFRKRFFSRATTDDLEDEKKEEEEKEPEKCSIVRGSPMADAIELKFVLSDSRKVHFFLQYIQSSNEPNYSRMVLFYLEIMQYRILARLERQRHAFSIFEKYLRADSGLEIELLTRNEAFIAQFRKQLHSTDILSIQIFDKALKIVLDDLKAHCYPGFTWHPQYAAMMKEIAGFETSAEAVEYENVTQMLKSKDITMIFMIYLARKRQHSVLALWKALHILSQPEIDKFELVLYLYKTFLSTKSTLLCDTIPEEERNIVRQEIVELVDIFEAAEASPTVEARLTSLCERLIGLKDGLLQSLQSGFFQLFLESDLYTLARRRGEDSYLLQVFHDAELAKGLRIYRRSRPSEQRDSLALDESVVPIIDVQVLAGVARPSYALSLKAYAVHDEEAANKSSISHEFFSPGGLELLFSSEKQNVTAFNFVSTNDEGDRQYCACLIMYPSEQKIPHILCIRSQLPVLVSLRQRLEMFYHTSLKNAASFLQADFKSLVQDLVLIPQPSDPLGMLPPIDFSMDRLFSCLEIYDVVELVTALLLERRVLLISSYYTILTVVAESLLTLLYPIKWCHIYAPVLPRKMLETLECPTPFLAGIRKSYAKGSDFPDLHDVYIVDLDRGHVVNQENHPSLAADALSELTNGLYEKVFPHVVFSDSVASFAANLTQPPAYPTTQVRRCFYNFVYQLIRGYRRFCVELEAQNEKESAILLDEKGFITSRAPNLQKFAQEFIQTQGFISLISQHSISSDFHTSKIISTSIGA